MSYLIGSSFPWMLKWTVFRENLKNGAKCSYLGSISCYQLWTKEEGNAGVKAGIGHQIYNPWKDKRNTFLVNLVAYYAASYEWWTALEIK